MSDTPYPAELSQANIAWFQKLLDKYQLGHYEAILAPSLEPCIGMEPAGPDDYSQIGVSRLGGVPDWPPDWDWPVLDHETQSGRVAVPMAFVCQINLAEIAHLVSPLPKHGLLYFFWDDYEAPVSCRVCYFDGDLACLQQAGRQRPQTLAEILMGLNFEDTPAARPHLLQFHSALSLPCSGEFERVYGDQLDFVDGEFDDFLELSEELMGDWRHYLFGYHFSHLSLRALGESEGELKGLTLMCFHSDEDVGIDFAEEGPLHLLIAKEQLQACDFSQIQLSREAT